jgi:hypothetical protein
MPSFLAATSLTTTGSATLTKSPGDNLAQFTASGTYGTVTFVFEGTIDGSNWFPVAANLQSTGAPATGTISPTDDAELCWNILAAGFSGVRLRVTAISSGTFVVTAQSNSIAGLPTPPTTNISTYGAITATGAMSSTSSIKSSSATGGVGYATGAGGAVEQATSRTTGVTVNAACGSITLVSAAGSATPFSFTVTNSAVAATDTVVISQKSGTDIYTTQVVSAVGAGSFRLTLANASGTTTEQPVFNFAVIKAVAA